MVFLERIFNTKTMTTTNTNNKKNKTMPRGGQRQGAGAKKKEVVKDKYFTFKTDNETKEAVKTKYGKSFVKMFNQWVKSILKEKENI